MKIIFKYDIEQYIKKITLSHLKDIKLFLILFITSIVIYGQKLFFYPLATDDYSRFYSAGEEQASWLGRWMATIINQNIFTDALHVLPYINTLIGVFSFTLAGFLMAKYLKTKNNFDISVTTLLAAITPYVAHNFYFNTNISTWITTLFGVAGLIFAYKPNKLNKFIGFVLLVMAVGTYQTIVQITIAMIIIKTTIDITKAITSQEIKRIVLVSFAYIGFVLLAFAASLVANHLYMLYHHLEVAHRFKKAEQLVEVSIYLDRILSMYRNAFNMSFGLHYFQNKFVFLYKAIFSFSVVGIVIYIFKKDTIKTIKLVSIVLITILFASLPLIINLPLITGNSIPTRAHYTVGWVLAGLFVLQSITLNNIFKTISYILAVSLIVVNIYYVNVFFDGANRQTRADIIRINQIVNRIRIDNNYTKEPMKFKIIGKKSYPSIGWNNSQQALNKKWSKYAAFKNFTDFKFSSMNDTEYKKIIKYLIKQNINKIDSYPAKNSIIVYQNKAIVVLNNKVINQDIEKIQKFKYFEKFIKLTDIKPNIKDKFILYVIGNDLYYYKKDCKKEDLKHKFFLHLSPQNIEELPKNRQKYKYDNLDFNFHQFGLLKGNICVAHRKLPNYSIVKIQTGQFANHKRDWNVSLKLTSK